MIWRSIDIMTGTSGNYRCYTTVDTNGTFKSAYVTAYADIPASCELEKFGQDYHDSDEVFVWGSYETTVKAMGWKDTDEMLSEFRKRFKTTRQFKRI